MKEIKMIAFYLPQFHSIPENDNAYGKGFTEWTNVKKAKPLFDGHNQPRIPLDKNYYNLLNVDVMKRQCELAKKYGVYGFCYYHYWFKGGKKLLEKPIELMLEDKSIDMPFCLCWANENWTKKWDGGNNELIVSQDYGDYNDIVAHVTYLKKFFQDDRYIKIDEKPLLIIYKPELIPHLRKYIARIRKEAISQGIGEIVIACQYPKFYIEGVNLDLFDFYIQFQPRFVKEYELDESKSAFEKTSKKILISIGLRNVAKKVRSIISRKKVTEGRILEKRSYDKDWRSIIDYKVNDKKLIAGSFVDWDNTARNVNGLVYLGASPVKFRKYMDLLKQKVENEYSEKMIFINAWNEWAEGAYLEPDEKNKYGYLDALKSIFD